jgi:multidrug resistance efflux pump
VESLFRQRAIEATQQRCFGPVIVATPPGVWLLLLAALTLLLLLGAAITLIEVPDRVTAVGVLVPSDDLLLVRAQRAGWVERLQVSNGDRVSIGTPLLTIADAEIAPQRRPAAAELRESLQTELTLLTDDLRLELLALWQRREEDERRRLALQKNLQSARAEMRARAEGAQLQQARATRLQTLLEAQLVSNQSAEAARLQALDAAAAEHELQRVIYASRLELTRIEATLAGYDGMAQRMAIAAEVRRQSLQRQLAGSHVQAMLQVLARGHGVVASLSVREGSFVQPGQLLMTLHEPGSALEARLFVAAAAAGRIQRGQEVHLQLDAYPRQIYGSHRAEVTEVSAVAVAASELALPLPLTGPVFELRAVAKGDAGLAWQLPPGTVVRAQVIRHRWPLLQWLLRSSDGGRRAA